MACALLCLAGRGAGTDDELAALLSTASRELVQFSFEHPHGLFRRAAALAAPGSEAWQQAVFGQAVCAQHLPGSGRAESEEAAALYQRLLELAPQSPYAPRARLDLGRLAELSNWFGDPIDLPAARAHYRAVMEGWPDREIAGEAALRLAAAHVQTYREDEVRAGIAVLEGWLAAHPDEPLAAAMWQYLGDTWRFPLEEWRKALDCYIRADDLGLLWRGREGVFYWRMAVIADRHLQDRELAVRYYTKVVTRAATSGKAYEAQRALARLGAPVPPITVFRVFDDPPAGDSAGASAP